MAPLVRVPSAPQVGSLHGRPYGWRRSCPPPRAISCLRHQAWLTRHDTCMNEVRAGYRTRTVHHTAHGNYPLPCLLRSLSRPLCAHDAEQCAVPPLPFSTLPLSAPAFRPSHVSCVSYLFRPARALFPRPRLPSLHDTTQARCTRHLWGRAALWQHAAALRLVQCPRALRAARSVVGHLFVPAPCLLLQAAAAYNAHTLVCEQHAPFPALPSLTLCPPASASTVRSNLRGNTPSLPPPLCPGPLALSCPLSARPPSPCPAPRPWLQGLWPPVSLSPSSLLKPVRTPVAIFGSVGVCIYVPASRHWLISYSPIHLT